MNELHVASTGTPYAVRPSADLTAWWTHVLAPPALGPLRTWTVMLWALVLSALGLGALTFLLGHDTHSAAAYAARFLMATGRHDSWAPMFRAIDLLRAMPDAPLYTKLFFTEHLKFQYPITSLLFIDLPQRVSGLGWPAMKAALNWSSWLAVWATAVLSWRLFVGPDGQLIRGAAPSDRWLLLGAIIALTLVFYPFTRSYVLGQIQTIITLLVAVALLAWRGDAKWLAGLCLGLCCTIKPQWGLVFLWALLRREWTMIAAGGAVVMVVGIAAGVLYGFGQYLDYLPALAYMSQHGESYFPNQSVNGLVNRLLATGNNLHWVGDAFPAYHPVVHATTVISSVAILGAALLYRRRAQPEALDLALMILSLTIASPIAWEHHYGALLPIFALAAPIAIARKPFGRATAVYLIIAFVLASERLDLANRLWDTPLNPLQSYLFFAGLMVAALLYRLAGSAAAAAPAALDTPAIPPSAGVKPLCVDLDGTLIRTDVLIESLLAACRSWAALKRLPRLVLGGKAALKAGLAESCAVACDLLPYDEALIRFLIERKQRGERLILVTGTHISVAERINAHLGGLFDEVMGSDARRNLRGENKARALVERFGAGGYTYIGNDATDLATWRSAAGAMLIGASARLIRRARMLAPVERVFSHRPVLLPALVRELRPHQWVKNLLVFVPILTSGDVFHLQAWLAGIIAFAGFCAAASGVYVVNDLLDLEADRRHPRKRSRPLASGALPIRTALVLAPVLFATAGVLSLWAAVLPYVALYALGSLAYSAKLKTMPLIDVFLLAGLYSVRLYAGGVATEHPVSLWLIAFSGFLFLGLALMKRVVELRDIDRRGETNVGRRDYRTGDLAILAAFGTSSTFISSVVLVLYVQSDAALALTNNRYALWTVVPLMLFWQCRLWLATSRGYMSDDPIVFTAHDWVSALVAAGLLAAMIIARAPL